MMSLSVLVELKMGLTNSKTCKDMSEPLMSHSVIFFFFCIRDSDRTTSHKEIR